MMVFVLFKTDESQSIALLRHLYSPSILSSMFASQRWKASLSLTCEQDKAIRTTKPGRWLWEIKASIWTILSLATVSWLALNNLSWVFHVFCKRICPLLNWKVVCSIPAAASVVAENHISGVAHTNKMNNVDWLNSSLSIWAPLRQHQISLV